MKKFFVEWVQDCGYGAAMLCSAHFMAENRADAEANWRRHVYEQNGCPCHPYFHDQYESLHETYENPKVPIVELTFWQSFLCLLGLRNYWEPSDAD